ncbi:putative ripening-related protein 1 [Cynara cardunculus var. scolymus]|uniref:Barwin-like endoglucanase n=1 Tax=Cynara cardunculus var. scolymus TaxID=59895 RepID=A0A103XHW5_CYNCS|nr:putative ripening-related protein 1 [Cynara cardunculus var. scolymus]KVH91081.1 Barwin-like endoglucanase [Cynara cardunculus var. scolymus]
MTQSAIVFLVLLPVLVPLFISCIDAQSSNTDATMTINSFEKGGSGGGPSECDGKYHSDDTPIVALSSRWYDHGRRCFKFININYNDKSVQAMVVDECDSSRGCHDDIVDASKAVWTALAVPGSQWGETKVTWSDA